MRHKREGLGRVEAAEQPLATGQRFSAEILQRKASESRLDWYRQVTSSTPV